MGDVGWYTSIGIDSNNKVHISYYDSTNGTLKYATNKAGSWTTECVDSYENGVGKYTSIAIDSNNSVHISYYEYYNQDLKYATNATGEWVRTTLDTDGAVGLYTSIGIDSGNKVHISYQHYSGYLKYATNKTGAWVTETVNNEGIDEGWWPSISIDSDGKVHISHWGSDVSSQYDLKYSTNATGSWVTETVDIMGDVGKYSSIALDSYNKVHISYFDDTNDDLKYASKTTGSWVTETIDSSGSVGMYTSIAVDHKNGIHISYHDNTNNDLKYATKAAYEISVFKTGSGTGRVRSNPAEIDCGSICSAFYTSGTTVNFTAAADSGSTFSGWSGACTGTGTCTVIMDASKSVNAIFDIQAPLSANAGPKQVVYDTVILDGSASQGRIISWSWTLTHQTNPDYNRTATGEKPVLSNLSAGFYDVTLTVTDDSGASDISNMMLVVVPLNVVSDIRTGWYSQQQLDEAVNDANSAKNTIIAEKEQTITTLNTAITSKDQTIASMFTLEQLNQAVTEERLKWDVNNDGKMGLEEVIYILQMTTGIR